MPGPIHQVNKARGGERPAWGGETPHGRGGEWDHTRKGAGPTEGHKSGDMDMPKAKATVVSGPLCNDQPIGAMWPPILTPTNQTSTARPPSQQRGADAIPLPATRRAELTPSPFPPLVRGCTPLERTGRTAPGWGDRRGEIGGGREGRVRPFPLMGNSFPDSHQWDALNN